jgi:preprotein translocase subunit SecB
MTGVSDMKLINYKVLKTFFELNDKYEFKEDKINIQPLFTRNVEKIDDSKYKIKLEVKVTSDVNKAPIPFIAEIVISSIFELPNWEDETINKIAIDNATAIMFPYLRTLLATITMNGNIPPYTLPVMNVSKLFIDSIK